MTRASSIVERYQELVEKSTKHINPVPSNGVGNPYHGKGGKFVSADKAVTASKRTNALKAGSQQRVKVDGWKDNERMGGKTAKIKPTKSPAGPQICGRAARKKGLDIRCHDGKVMAGHAKLKAAADSKRKKK
ncbi:MAG: hypothetical protein GY833_22250 [Aestuariibacter sp.]|nr:hypothetical protein [Aestuariibacter sp.]|tara:strand:+ start:20252 stop:20647 length:396 start_codon:yes stop_codon:yes gene_type:complete